jgi:two-component system chemotaxis response regulator CheY
LIVRKKKVVDLISKLPESIKKILNIFKGASAPCFYIYAILIFMDDFEQTLKANFLTDTTDMLYQLQSIFETIEKTKMINDDQAKVIFRNIHTIKGNAQATGFEDLSHAVHAFEDILVLLKDKKISANKELIELFHNVLIKIQDSLEDYQSDIDAFVDYSDLIQLINAYDKSGNVPEKKPEAPKKYKIVVIDDDQSTREILIEVLAAVFNADFFEYDDAANILADLPKIKFDLILTDFQMPILDGNSFIKKLRLENSINSATPVMFITGEKPEIISEEKIAKDIYYIQKPFEFKRIIYYAKLSFLST